MSHCNAPQTIQFALSLRLIDKPFLMPIENVYSIAGRGTVVTGKIEQGVVRAGDSVEIVGLASETRSDVITQVESFGEVLESGNAGDNVGMLLRKTAHTAITKGQVLAKAGSVAPHQRFEAEVYVLKKEEGVLANGQCEQRVPDRASRAQ